MKLTTMMKTMQRGFTLIEILVTMAITGIVMSAVYSVYIANMYQARGEEQRVDIQQGQRFAIDLLSNQLRHAGYNLEEITGTGQPTIVAAGADYIYFTADLNDDANSGVADGDTNDLGEHIVFCKYTDANGTDMLGYINGNGAGDADGDGIADIGDIDADGDGFADAGHAHGHQPVLPIEELEFYYTPFSGAASITPADPSAIRSVQISLLARTETPDPKFIHPGNVVYNSAGFSEVPPAPGTVAWTGYNDNFRRRLMIANVHFRNMGL